MVEKFVIRLAEPRDIKTVFDLSNDDTVRTMSIHPEKIEWESHVKWFDGALKNPDLKFYVAESADGDFIGQIRFARNSAEWIVSISLVEKYRGKGMAKSILHRSIELSNLKNIVACIYNKNYASLNVFERQGSNDVRFVTYVFNNYCVCRGRVKSIILYVSSSYYVKSDGGMCYAA